ncbi:hypothetical protein SAMN07250955_108118 [Arboricoccus pini]|uniref:Uncharacterized protein n=1 Tax=Arboricoccus pini TaxID=1963835 RepID=A0A212RGQ0_9PROT|nr:hypothetical protein SAMN07250955_108118 [Arboricoccus pini]
MPPRVPVPIISELYPKAYPRVLPLQGQSGQDVVQLAHVALPVMPGQHGGCFLLDPGAGRRFLCQYRQEEREVRAFDQTRQENVGHAQSVEEIASETASLDSLGEVDIGGGHELDIDLTQLRSARQPDLSIVEKTEQNRLQGGAHAANLIQEQGATVGLDDKAGRAAPCVRR